MDDLSGVFDELMAFAAVVEAGGFNAAGDRIGVPPSRLSRSVAALERKLQVVLLLRTSRRFSVTEVGWRTYERAVDIRARLQGTVAEAAQSAGEVSGHLRVSCPMALASALVGGLTVRFMQAHPRVRVTLESTDGRSRAFSEPVDLVIQPSVEPLRDSSLVARTLVQVRYVLTAAPGLQHGIPLAPEPGDFPCFPAIGWTFFAQPARWQLQHPVHGACELPVDVRFCTDNLLVIREAALAGVGVAQLPARLCAEDLCAGRLQAVAAGWSPPAVSIHALYPSRRALTLAGRKYLEALAEGLSVLDAAPG